MYTQGELNVFFFSKKIKRKSTKEQRKKWVSVTNLEGLIVVETKLTNQWNIFTLLIIKKRFSLEQALRQIVPMDTKRSKINRISSGLPVFQHHACYRFWSNFASPMCINYEQGDKLLKVNQGVTDRAYILGEQLPFHSILKYKPLVLIYRTYHNTLLSQSDIILTLPTKTNSF